MPVCTEIGTPLFIAGIVGHLDCWETAVMPDRTVPLHCIPPPLFLGANFREILSDPECYQYIWHAQYMQ